MGKLVSDKTAADTQWREQRQADKETASALRDASVMQITSAPEKFAHYLNMRGDNPSYSAGNVALAMTQLPEATIVHTRSHWKDLGRFMRDPELNNGASVFTHAPSGRGYNLSDVYDIAQTQGRELGKTQLKDDMIDSFVLSLSLVEGAYQSRVPAFLRLLCHRGLIHSSFAHALVADKTLHALTFSCEGV